VQNILELLILAQEPDGKNPLEWQRDALCSQTDPEVFFPEQLRNGSDAKQICKMCPVKKNCYDYAVGNEEKSGIWGGVDFTIRKTIREDEDDYRYKGEGTRPVTILASEFTRRTKEGGRKRL
jgi:hypothetical protein